MQPTQNKTTLITSISMLYHLVCENSSQDILDSVVHVCALIVLFQWVVRKRRLFKGIVLVWELFNLSELSPLGRVLVYNSMFLPNLDWWETGLHTMLQLACWLVVVKQIYTKQQKDIFKTEKKQACGSLVNDAFHVFFFILTVWKEALMAFLLRDPCLQMWITSLFTFCHSSLLQENEKKSFIPNKLWSFQKYFFKIQCQ